MSKSALYRFYGEADVLLYVGISQCPFTRSKAHEATAPWYHDIRFMEVEWHDTREDAYRAEAIAIDRERPKHNIASRHQIRKVAKTSIGSEKLPRAPYYNCGPQLPSMQGPPLPGNTYSLGGPEFRPDHVPPNRRFGPERIELVRKVMREGDMFYLDPSMCVPDDYIPSMMLDGIYVMELA